MTPRAPRLVVRKRHKYNVAPKADRMVDGVVFDSKAEATRYRELQLMERANEITSLECQYKFAYWYKDVKVFTYIADFVYRHIKSRQVVIEDVKGVRTPIYRLKKKLIELQYGFTITEI